MSATGIYYFEHAVQPIEFASVFHSLWWAIITITTVGYGDKAPISPLGRFIAIFWMFLSIIIISSLTASITTALTMEKISTNIEDFKDLVKIKTAEGIVNKTLIIIN